MSAPVAEQVSAGSWKIDPIHSHVGFAVKHMVVANFRGSFDRYDGGIVAGDDGQPVLTGTVDVGSIVVKDENLAAHLQSPEFFDAERHPELSFSGTATAPGAFEGEITIKGVTKPATLAGTIVGPVTDAYGNERYALRLETVIDRTDFGIEWNAPLPGGGFALSNNVKLKADLTLVKAA